MKVLVKCLPPLGKISAGAPVLWSEETGSTACVVFCSIAKSRS